MTATGCRLLYRGLTCALYLLVLVAALTSGEDPPQACDQVLVIGSGSQADATGEFISQPQRLNGRPVYKHRCQELFLYFVAAQTRFWIIGPEAGGMAGYLLSYDAAREPAKITLPWRSWNADQSRWDDDRGVQVICKANGLYCNQFVVTGRNVSSAFYGPYRLTQHTRQGRPVYVNDNATTFVRYTSDQNCGKWVFSPSLSSRRFFMTSFDDVASPLHVTRPWSLPTSPNGNWMQMRDVSITCTKYLSDKNSCGERKVPMGVSAMLLDGVVTTPGKWPFQVAVIRGDGVLKCGGTLISRRWILSAAHCLRDTVVSEETVIVGNFDTNITEVTQRSYSIKQVHLHPNFTWTTNPFRIDYDIGLIELEYGLPYDDHVQPACIIPEADVFPFDDVRPNYPSQLNDTYTDCYILGWGEISYRGPIGGKLRELQVKELFDTDRCVAQFYTGQDWVKDTGAICLTSGVKGRLCRGDSGSPLLCQREGRWTVMGIGSWSLSECHSWVTNVPSVYTSLPMRREWLDSVMTHNPPR